MSEGVKRDQFPAWHTLESEVVLARLSSDAGGLTEEEAGERLRRYGLNRLSPAKKRGPLRRFLAQFHNVLIYVLLAAGVITVLLGHWIDAGVIFGVVAANALIGFIQEGRAERALEAIRTMLSLRCLVLRDGRRRQLPAERLVPGDIVILQSGDKVPADLRLLRVRDLRIDEAALTGESVPVAKTAAPVEEAAAVSDRPCMTYAGTLVTYGRGAGTVVATGDHTELGRINQMLARVQPLTTRLLRRIAEFGRLLTGAILGLALATFVFGILADRGGGGLGLCAGRGEEAGHEHRYPTAILPAAVASSSLDVVFVDADRPILLVSAGKSVIDKGRR